MIKEKYRLLKDRLSPYHELIKFVLVFLCFHFFWKWAMTASEGDEHIYFFSTEISHIFFWITDHLALVTRYLIELITGTDTFLYQDQIYFNESPGICVVWSCSGMKQYLITILILLFASGSWKHKLWYIPLSIILVYLLNLIRLVGVGIVTIDHMNWFDFFHRIIFRGVLYGGIFLIWLFWVEKIAKQKQDLGSH